MYSSLEYNVYEEYIEISSIFGLKKDKIFFKDIKGYLELVERLKELNYMAMEKIILL